MKPNTQSRYDNDIMIQLTNPLPLLLYKTPSTESHRFLGEDDTRSVQRQTHVFSPDLSWQAPPLAVTL